MAKKSKYVGLALVSATNLHKFVYKVDKGASVVTIEHPFETTDIMIWAVNKGKLFTVDATTIDDDTVQVRFYAPVGEDMKVIIVG
jgi:hypothetical protein